MNVVDQDPKRWVENPETSPEGALMLLKTAESPPPMPPFVLARSAVEVSKLKSGSDFLVQMMLRLSSAAATIIIAGSMGFLFANIQEEAQLLVPSRESNVDDVEKNLDGNHEEKSGTHVAKTPLPEPETIAKREEVSTQIEVSKSGLSEAMLLKKARESLDESPRIALEYLKLHSREHRSSERSREREALIESALSRISRGEDIPVVKRNHSPPDQKNDTCQAHFAGQPSTICRE